MQSTILIALLVFVDQLSKILVKFNLTKYQRVDILGDILRFTYVENQGIAFGIDTSRFHILIVLITLFAIDRILVLIPSFNYFGVIDFIDMGIGNYRWFIFNLADTFITIGVILYFILHYKFNKEYNAPSRNIK